MKRAAGFTLLELLIAIAIFALLAIGTWRMLGAVLDSDEYASRINELSTADQLGNTVIALGYPSITAFADVKQLQALPAASAKRLTASRYPATIAARSWHGSLYAVPITADQEV